MNQRRDIDITGLTSSEARAAQEPSISGRVFTIILFGLVVLFLFVALLFGMDVYKSIDSTRTANDNARLSLSLVANSIRGNDVTDSVGVGNGPEGPSLVLTDTFNETSYETRIYSYQGMVVEEYSLAGTEYTPERAREIVESKEFSFTYSNGLLTVITDQGETSVVLRSVRKSA